tara:strand:+ start:22 stop:405 length:384 start_codon:yes stop_codon:yes gene_type:complete
MFKWLFKSLLEEHVNELVDKRFKERVYERYWEQRQSQMEERIRRVKESLGTSSHGVDAKKAQRIQKPSSILEVSGSKESRIQSKATKVNQETWFEDTLEDVAKAREIQAKRKEMDSLRSKLTGGKKK